MTNQPPLPSPNGHADSDQPQLPVPPAAAASTPAIRIHLPQYAPVVTYIILALTVLVYLAQMGSTFFFQYDYVQLAGMKINDLIVSGQLWRLLTPILLHGSLLHIGFNMYALHVLGPQLERFYGHWQFLLLYLVGGFTGVVFSFVLTTAPSLGASTSIFALLGAQGVLAYKNQQVFGPRARQSLRSIVNIAVVNFLIGMAPGIDNWAHLGGLLGGVLIAWFGGPEFRMAGTLPDLRAENKKNGGQLVMAATITALLFGALTIWTIARY